MSPGTKAARRAFVLEGRFRRFFSNVGPGLITGAADDDPSGISTYSVTGAAFGYAPLWTAILFPADGGHTNHVVRQYRQHRRGSRQHGCGHGASVVSLLFWTSYRLIARIFKVAHSGLIRLHRRCLFSRIRTGRPWCGRP
jgi:hypothetical protein